MKPNEREVESEGTSPFLAGKCSIRWLQHLMCQVLQTQFSVVQSWREQKNEILLQGERGNFEEKSCMYILYAIYNGVSRIQLTVYLRGWKESKEGEGYLFQSKKKTEGEGWKGEGEGYGRLLAVSKMRNALFKKNKNLKNVISTLS